MTSWRAVQARRMLGMANFPAEELTFTSKIYGDNMTPRVTSISRRTRPPEAIASRQGLPGNHTRPTYYDGGPPDPSRLTDVGPVRLSE